MNRSPSKLSLAEIALLVDALTALTEDIAWATKREKNTLKLIKKKLETYGRDQLLK